MPLKQQRLYINIDHVATLRQARRGNEPDPAQAAVECERAADALARADGITAHLREDRRHIQDRDVETIRALVSYFNLEMAATAEMLGIADNFRPNQVTLVPERREEITTEGGLDVMSDPPRIQDATSRLAASDIRASLFIDPELRAVEQARKLGAAAIELHTGAYANRPSDPSCLEALRAAARRASELGLAVHAGHGLTVANVGPVAAIPEVEELNIGHSIISRAVFVGLAAAVREIRTAMNAARALKT